MSYQFANQSHSINQTSSFGLAPNIASLVSYVWIPVTSIAVLVTEKENCLVRFHAWQALFLGLSLFALTIVLSIVIGVVTLVAGAISPYAGLLVSVVSLLLWMVIAIGMLGVWVMCLMKAYRGTMYKLPLVGKFAENMANK